MAEGFITIADADDHLAELVNRAAEQRGMTVTRLGLAQASRKFTVALDASGVQVDPCVPLFLRPAYSGILHDETERFAWNEDFAAVWSAAALTPATVINRPNVYGWGSQCSFSAASTEVRLGEPVSASEYFWSGLPPERAQADGGTEPSGTLHHQDLDTWLTVEHVGQNTSIRSRLLPPCKGWEQVVVVGNRGWRVTSADLPFDQIEADSVARGRLLDLAFLTVSWAIPEYGDPILVRTNPFPSLEEIQPVATEVLDALITILVPQ